MLRIGSETVKTDQIPYCPVFNKTLYEAGNRKSMSHMEYDRYDRFWEYFIELTDYTETCGAERDRESNKKREQVKQKNELKLA